MPVMLAPIGSIESFDPGGGASSAKASAEFGIPQMLSSVCNPGLEAVAKAADNFRIFQLYVRGDDAWVDDHVKRAPRPRLRGVLSHGGHRRVQPARARPRQALRQALAHARRGLRLPGRASPGITSSASRTPTRTCRWSLKGIATAEDAALAVEHGVEVVYVSNHGGRQLDHGRGSMDVLPEVVDAVTGRATIIVDGAFMRGTDVVKAIASGANAVGVGRLECLGLAAAGVPGLVRALELLEDEIRISLGLLGVPTLAGAEPLAPARGDARDAAARHQRVPAARGGVLASRVGVIGVVSPGGAGGGPLSRNTLSRSPLPALARGHEICAGDFGSAQKTRFRGERPRPQPARRRVVVTHTQDARRLHGTARDEAGPEAAIARGCGSASR